MSPEICDLVVEKPEIWARFANRFAIHKTSRPGAFTFNPELNFVLTTDADQYLRESKFDTINLDQVGSELAFTVPDGKLWRIILLVIGNGGTVAVSYNLKRGGVTYAIASAQPTAGATYVWAFPHPIMAIEGDEIWRTNAGAAGVVASQIHYLEEDLF